MSQGRERYVEVIERRFDSAAATYETMRLAGWYKAQAAEVLAALDARAEGVLLDVGCGTGFLLREALAAHPQLRGLGIDLSSAMIAAARDAASHGTAGDRLAFLQADWEAMDGATLYAILRGRPVCTAVCVSAFHYFADPVAAARRIHDTLTPGGTLLLLERAKDRSLMTRSWDILHKIVIRDRVRFYESAELVQLLREAGFADVEPVSRTKKYLWKGKLYTDLTLISARRAVAGPNAAENGDSHTASSPPDLEREG